ncbi:acyl-CoA dehydratase activase [Fusibacter sp. 3D3]|uniref:acyl-CoA dehydratase activase n=1 Tax=Fusibacter sp. 3D3 TaxID=1048380 RepID=UPI0008530649|nr:acyl-CoA dehydratase activase [Fusibacter sp. 3D3]GAU76706.1 benzoyl-CoA reductase subunit BadG [Fusibacter sp. 3D3]
MKILGIDLGSREVKLVVMEEGFIIEKKKISTMQFYRDYCAYKDKIVVDFEKLKLGKFDAAISTGYGRNNVDLESFTVVNEVKAHVQGAVYQSNLRDFILVDVGGQDIKIMQVEKGKMMDMALNDKCAASCGRYLENMAQILEVDMDRLSTYAENPVALNSTCAVFTESELIGKIAEGIRLEHLCAGVNYSLYKRLKPMLTKFKGNRLLVAGGVAYNKALISYLKQDYQNVICLKEPQFNGAIGCCVLAHKKRQKSREGATYVLS